MAVLSGRLGNTVPPIVVAHVHTRKMNRSECGLYRWSKQACRTGIKCLYCIFTRMWSTLVVFTSGSHDLYRKCLKLCLGNRLTSFWSVCFTRGSWRRSFCRCLCSMPGPTGTWSRGTPLHSLSQVSECEWVSDRVSEMTNFAKNSCPPKYCSATNNPNI